MAAKSEGGIKETIGKLFDIQSWAMLFFAIVTANPGALALSELDFAAMIAMKAEAAKKKNK